jgi:hypothetical protein
MIAIKSTFQFEQFVIIKSDLIFRAPKNQSSGDGNFVNSLVNQYLIDIDYGFQENTEYIQLFMKISINKNDAPIDGYQIFAEGVGFIRKTNQAPNHEFIQALHISGLSMALNQLRAFVVSLTNFAPLGKYVIPAIDLDSLILGKNQQTKARSSKVKVRSNKVKVKPK